MARLPGLSCLIFPSSNPALARVGRLLLFPEGLDFAPVFAGRVCGSLVIDCKVTWHLPSPDLSWNSLPNVHC